MSGLPTNAVSVVIAAAIVLVAPAAAAQWPLGPQPMQPSMPVLGTPVPLPGARETEQRLDDARQSDAGRRLEWVWIDAHGGFEQIGLTTFKGDKALTGAAPTSGSSGVVGAGLGARLLFFTFLVRGRIGIGPLGKLYRIGPEVGFHVPLGRVEPHVALGAGYAAFGGDLAGLRGGYGRVNAGVDYFLASVFSLGLDVSGEILGTRMADASGVGGTVAITGVAGLHF